MPVATMPGVHSPHGPPQRLRVANVCRVLWNGGVQRVAIAQTEMLRESGFDCDLYFLRRTSSAIYDLPPGTRLLDPPVKEHSPLLARISTAITRLYAGHRGRDATVDLDRLADVRRSLLAYDVVVYNDQYAALAGGLNRIVSGQPYVMMFHEFYPKVGNSFAKRLFYPMADLFDAVSLLLAPAIVTTSDRIQRRLESIVPGRSRLARLGAPTPLDHERVADKDPRMVVALTIWDRGRHPELYLDLARRAPQYRFVLVGGWTREEHLQEVRREAASLPNVTITGSVDEGERDRWLSRALVYLRYGFGESGPGMGGLEALSHGNLVIANRGLGISETITDGMNGFILEDNRPATAVIMLERISKLSPAELDQVSRHARALCDTMTWRSHGDALIRSIFDSMARSSRSPRDGRRSVLPGSHGDGA